MLIALVAAGALQAGLTPVPARDLVQLLDGVELEMVGIVIADGGDFFFPDGHYMRSGRATVWGTWRVEEGRLCYRLGTRNPAEGCYLIYSDDQGRLYRRPMIEVAGTRTEEIRFAPLMTDSR